jgi:PPOX class probable F420-dependent enzyme
MTPEHSALEAAASSPYVSLTTFRKSGVGVATPVWIARSGDELVAITVDGTGKTKRLARDPRVELRPCDVRGQVAQEAPVWAGVATVARDDESIASARSAIGSKYLMARLGDIGNRLTFGVFRRSPRAAIRIKLG